MIPNQINPPRKRAHRSLDESEGEHEGNNMDLVEGRESDVGLTRDGEQWEIMMAYEV